MIIPVPQSNQPMIIPVPQSKLPMIIPVIPPVPQFSASKANSADGCDALLYEEFMIKPYDCRAEEIERRMHPRTPEDFEAPHTTFPHCTTAPATLSATPAELLYLLPCAVYIIYSKCVLEYTYVAKYLITDRCILKSDLR